MIDTLSAALSRLLGMRSDFQRLFYQNELNALLGKKRRSLQLLAGFFLLTWLTLGYALGGLDNLDQRMNNPYTNWVDWQIPYDEINYKNLDRLTVHLADSTVRKNYYLGSLDGYCKEIGSFRRLRDGELLNFNGRTMRPDEQLFTEILSEKSGNVLAGLRYRSEGDWSPSDSVWCGIVVKEEMLQRLGYTDPIGQRVLPLPANDKTLYLPITAVVKDLPSLCDYVVTPRMYNLTKQGNYETTGLLQDLSGKPDRFHLDTKERNLDTAKAKIEAVLSVYKINDVRPDFLALSNTDTLFQYEVSFLKNYEVKKLDSMIADLKAQWPGIQKHYQQNCPEGKDRLKRPYYMAFNFEKLDKINEFKDLLQHEYSIALSIDQVEAKKNFALVSRLTYFLCIALFAFSITSIILFINNKLAGHLEQNKPNIGTVKAFGLSNQQLMRLYASIIMAFLLLGLLFAGVAVSLFALADHWSHLGLIKPFDWRILLAFVLLLAVSLAVSVRTVTYILRDTPGNLIYGR